MTEKTLTKRKIVLKPKNYMCFLILGVLLVLFAVLYYTGNMKRSSARLLHQIAYSIILAVSLNLVVGFLGELSLGHAGFMYVGAIIGCYAGSLLGKFIPVPLVTLILSLIVGGAVAAVFGLIIGLPALRLKGDYLAIVTLAFGEIIRNVINCLYISLDGQRLHIAFNNPNVAGKLLVNGPAGATGVNKMATFGMGFALTLFTLFVVLNLIDSRSGRAIMAIRDNRIAAEAMGLNVTKYKMMAFVTSAVLAGMAGALYGLNFSTVAASKFKFDTSILVLVFVVLGGIGNIRGSIISATLLTILPELLRAFANYRMLIYAIVLILVMLATNNPTLRGMVERIIPRGKGRKKEADEA